ncbi:hypothetical protein PZ897_01825 [Hoeflea sp. YIM 152468]|uniref:DUF6916 family protein n=1 Tax=Hoeflea sp. YIM 152468 TaxID=3031759 RepID=UPI0023DA9463|nr:hypothetical protein [Hoeflea sp. YIM 152468]MDF1606908.1 hypothetical protein [Hoeflea sp. YIM 152468]
MIAELTADRFEPLNGTIFTVASVQPQQHLRLIEVLRRGKGERVGGSFSLLWQSDAEEVLPQGSYVLAHDSLGELELFIVPVGQASEGVHYEAVFT